ncbi:unnamed protein product [Rotaria sp. Silwood1]|nr:unnamed protein product [Rotaria sp. Silwood1]
MYQWSIKAFSFILIQLNKVNSMDKYCIYVFVYHFHRNELIRLGNHINLCELYIKNSPNNYYLYQSIHYDRNYSHWYIIKV